MNRTSLNRTVVILVILLAAMLAVSCSGDMGSKISVSSLSIVPAQSTPDQSVKIGINVQNSGKKPEDYSGVLKINDSAVETKQLTVAAEATETLIFEYTPTESGLFRVDVNGQMGSFKVVKPAAFVADNLTVDLADALPGSQLTAGVKVSNTGELSGEYTTTLKVDGKEVDSSSLALDGGDSQSISFSFSIDSAGRHGLEINGMTKDFAILRPANFKAGGVTVNPSSALPGEKVTISASLTNEGEVKDSQNVILKVNGSQSGSQSLTLEGGASANVSYSFLPNTEGSNNVDILGATGSFTVVSLSKYSNSAFHYAISYPPAFQIDEDDPSMVIINQKDIGGLSVDSEYMSTKGTPQDYLESVIASNQEQYSDWKLVSQKSLTKGSEIYGYRFEYSCSEDGIKFLGNGLVVKNAGLGYSVDFWTDEKDWPRYATAAGRCLDSFAPPPSFSGSYSNPNKGLALMLPPEWSLTEISSNSILFISPYDQSYIGGAMATETISPGTNVQQYIESSLVSFTSKGWTRQNGASFIFADGSKGYQVYLSAVTTANKAVILKVFCLIKDNRAAVMTFFANSGDYKDEVTQLAGSLVLSKPGGIEGIDRQNAIIFPEGEIVTLDPALVETGPGDIVGAVFSGLVRLDTNLQIVPDLAESWKVSADGKVYTFNLRKNAKFQNGRAVTAADFKYSWERACDPQLKSPKAKNFLADILGANERLAGTSSSISGIKVVDDNTLEVTLTSSRSYFLGEICQPVAFVVDKADIARGSGWYENPNGAGPFKIKTWEKDSLVVLERNDDFYLGAAKVNNLIFKLFPGNPMTLYENGEIDITPVSLADQDKVLDVSNPLNKEMAKGSVFDVNYIGLNVTQAPFDDIKIRQAAAAALDVSKLIDVSLKGRSEKAAGYVPPGVPGNNPALQPIPFSPEKAKQLITESRYGSADKVPPITIYVVYAVTPVDQAIIGMWQNVGLKVSTQVVSSYEDYLARSQRKEFQSWIGGWRADYVDPQNFLDVLFQSQSPENHFAYNNPEVDAALAKAAGELDVTARIKMYQDIEKMILNDLPAIPLFCKSQEYALVKPYVRGYAIYPMDINIWRDLSVIAH